MRSEKVMQYYRVAFWVIIHIHFKMAFRLCRSHGLSKRLQDVFKVRNDCIGEIILVLCWKLSPKRSNNRLYRIYLKSTWDRGHWVWCKCTYFVRYVVLKFCSRTENLCWWLIMFQVFSYKLNFFWFYKTPVCFL